jgi:hypothetical protein
LWTQLLSEQVNTHSGTSILVDGGVVSQIYILCNVDEIEYNQAELQQHGGLNDVKKDERKAKRKVSPMKISSRR